MTSDLRPDMARPTDSLGDGFAEASWVASTAEAATAPDRPGKRPDFDLAYQFAARHLATEFHTAAVIDHDKRGLYVRIPTMPSRHTELKASTYSDLMPPTVLR